MTIGASIVIIPVKRSITVTKGTVSGGTVSGDEARTVSHPPCKRLDVYCHACDQVAACSYLRSQTPALPGDLDYVGVCSEVDGSYSLTTPR